MEEQVNINDKNKDYIDYYIAESKDDEIVEVKYLYTIKESGSRVRDNDALDREELKDKVEIITMEEYRRRQSDKAYENAIMANVFVIDSRLKYNSYFSLKIIIN